MLSQERKSFLIDVVTKFRELEGWCRNLHSEQDVKFLRSNGFSGFRLQLLLYVFIPLMVAIQTSFSGVPYFLSFLKKRLKRRTPPEKSAKGLRTRQKQHQRQKKSGVVFKCCKSCRLFKLDKIARERYQKEKRVVIEGKNLNTKRNYLKRLKKRIRKEVDVDFSVQEPSMVDLIIPGVSEPILRKKRNIRETRRIKRFEKFQTGEKIVSKDGLLPFLRGFSSFPTWTSVQVLAHYKPTLKGELLDGDVDVLPSVMAKAPFLQRFFLKFMMGKEFTREWGMVHARSQRMRSLERSSIQSTSLSFKSAGT